MEEQNIEIRSEKVRNIIGKMPSVLIRYGIGIIATILILMVAFSFFFRFTPVYDAPARVNINVSNTVINMEIPGYIKQYDTTVVLPNNLPVNLHVTVIQSPKVQISGKETSLFDYIVEKIFHTTH